MTYTPKDNSGSLFKNDKGENPARPDYKGDAMIDGVMMEIAAWIKEGAKGKFMSLSFKPKQARAEPTQHPAPQPRRQDPQAPLSHDRDFDGDIPF